MKHFRSCCHIDCATEHKEDVYIHELAPPYSCADLACHADSERREGICGCFALRLDEMCDNTYAGALL